MVPKAGGTVASGLFLLLLCSCAKAQAAVTPASRANDDMQNDQDDRALIIGGTPASFGDYPSFVLTDVATTQGVCGGYLIHSDIVLTAAHCEEQWGATGTNVYIGTTQLSGSDATQVRTIEDVVLHPEYFTSQQPFISKNDIMLMKLDTKTTGVPTAPWTSDPQQTPQGPLTILGFGRTSPGNDDPQSVSTVLLETSVTALPDATCQALYGQPPFFPEMMFCAGESSANVCNGDSGSPILDTSTGTVVGIASFGDCVNAASFVRVGAFDTWIKDTICLLSSHPPEDCPQSCQVLKETNLEANYGQELTFDIPVNTGDVVTCTTTGNNGDADLFLQFDYQNEADCESMAFDSSNEVCVSSAATADAVLTVTVGSYFMTLSDLTLVCTKEPCAAPVNPSPQPSQAPSFMPTFSTSPSSPPSVYPSSQPSSEPTILSRECAVVDEMGLSGGWKHAYAYSIVVYAGERVTCSLSTEDGVVRLSYENFSDKYTFSTWDPPQVTSSPAGHDYTLNVRAYGYSVYGFSGLEVFCTVSPCNPPCGNGKCGDMESCDTCPRDCGGRCCGNGICDNEFGETGRNCEADCSLCKVVEESRVMVNNSPKVYQVPVVAGDFVTCSMTGNSFYSYNADMRMQFTYQASPDCIADALGSTEECTSSAATQNSVLTVELYSLSPPYSEVSLLCTKEPCDLRACGDRFCSHVENCRSCSADCGQCCGNGVCDLELGENPSVCAPDCSPCVVLNESGLRSGLAEGVEFEVVVNEGDILTCNTICNNGDADLIIFSDDWYGPCRPSLFLNSTETCTTSPAPAFGTFRVKVYAMASFNDLELRCTKAPCSSIDYPSSAPSIEPTQAPSQVPSATPTEVPTVSPSAAPSAPTFFPTLSPTGPPKELGVDMCACQPSELTFTLDLSRTCTDSTTIAARPGLQGFFCDGTLTTPVVSKIEVQELTLNGYIDTTIDGPFYSGDSFVVHSVTASWTDGMGVRDVPWWITMTIYAGSNPVQNWQFYWFLEETNSACDVYPILSIGEVTGWGQLTALRPPPEAVCPIAPISSPPSNEPSVAPSTPLPTSSPTRSPDATPVERCACYPSRMEFEFDFTLTCFDSDVKASSPGILEFTCSQIVGTTRPTKITSIVVDEIWEGDSRSVPYGEYLNGQTFVFDSVSYIDPASLDAGTIPRILSISFAGEDADENPVQLSMQFVWFQNNNNCGFYPVLSGGSKLGWSRLVNTVDPVEYLCPAVKDTPTTMTHSSICFGDPHLTTFDGTDYTFNGLGEYVAYCAGPQSFDGLLNLCSPNALRLIPDRPISLSVNYRFAPFSEEHGATVTVGVAIEDPGFRNGEFAIVCVTSEEFRVLCFNGPDVVVFAAPTLGQTTTTALLEDGMTITRTADLGTELFLVRIVTPSGAVLELLEMGQVLQPSLILPASISDGHGFGLLGDTNGIPYGDLKTSTGIVLPSIPGATTAERNEQIFNDFGQTWMIAKANASLFQSLNETIFSFENYFNDSFVPIFDTPEMPRGLREAAQAACSDIESQTFREACLFDIAITENLDLFSTLAHTRVEVDAPARVIGVDVCACQPSVFEFALDFSLPCEEYGPNRPGLEDSGCLGGGDPPLVVSKIEIFESGRSEGGGSTNLTHIELEGPFADGDVFVARSITSTPENMNLSDTSTMPYRMNIKLYGVEPDSLWQDLYIAWFVRGAIPDCTIYPVLFAGDAFGSIRLSSFEEPKRVVCRLVRPPYTDMPSMSPTILSSPSPRPSFSPTIEPSSPPSLSPSSLPSSSPSTSAAPTWTGCACQPAEIAFKFQFQGLCRDRSLFDGSPGMSDTFCMVQNLDNPGPNTIPTTVSSVTVLENGGAAGRHSFDGPYYEGDTFTFRSVVRTDLDSIDQSKVPREWMFYVYGTNEAGDSLRFLLRLSFLNDCETYPIISVGDTFAWLMIVSLVEPPYRMCPRTAAPTPDPTALPSLTASEFATEVPPNPPSDGPTFSTEPSKCPSIPPTTSLLPSSEPSGLPTSSVEPSSSPSIGPSDSLYPSGSPSTSPSISLEPTQFPSSHPSSNPSRVPSNQPTNSHSNAPTTSAKPSGLPDTPPSPTTQQSGTPTIVPAADEADGCPASHACQKSEGGIIMRYSMHRKINFFGMFQWCRTFCVSRNWIWLSKALRRLKCGPCENTTSGVASDTRASASNIFGRDTQHDDFTTRFDVIDRDKHHLR